MVGNIRQLSIRWFVPAINKKAVQFKSGRPLGIYRDPCLQEPSRIERTTTIPSCETVLDGAGFHMIMADAGKAMPLAQREVVAVYDNATRTIYLPGGWTGCTPAELLIATSFARASTDRSPFRLSANQGCNSRKERFSAVWDFKVALNWGCVLLRRRKTTS